jgi:hypothetical protein
MSQIAIPSSVHSFKCEISALEHKIQALSNLITATEYPKLQPQLIAFEQQITHFYDQIDLLKVKESLIQCQKGELNSASQSQLNGSPSETTEQLKAIELAANELFSKFIEKGKSRDLRDRAENILMAIINANITKQFDDGLKTQWKQTVEESLRINAKINEYLVLVSADCHNTLDMLPEQVYTAGIKLKEIEPFSTEPIAKLMELIGKPFPTEAEESQFHKVQIDELLLMLDPQFQQRVDYFVYRFSVEPKGGEEWGKIHRYDDIEVLRKAFKSALWDHVRWTMPKSTDQTADLEAAFFRKFHQLVISHSKTPDQFPNVMVDSARKRRLEMMGKKGFDATKTISKAQAKQLTQMLRKGQQSFPEPAVEEKPLALSDFANRYLDQYPNELGQALSSAAGRECFQKTIYGQVRPNKMVKGYTIKSQQKSELEKIQHRLQFICEQNEDPAVVKEFISGCLVPLPVEQKAKVEEYVYFCSKDAAKGGERWGEFNAYNDPKVLLDAVTEAIKFFKKASETVNPFETSDLMKA